MSETQTLLLGFIAGVTILIGLPLGRVRAPRPGMRQFLNALAVGILLFLIWDVHGEKEFKAALSAGVRGLVADEVDLLMKVAREP